MLEVRSRRSGVAMKVGNMIRFDSMHECREALHTDQSLQWRDGSLRKEELNETNAVASTTASELETGTSRQSVAIEKWLAPLSEIYSDIRDAIKFITRKQRLPQRVIDEAALAAVREIYAHRKQKNKMVNSQ